MRFANNQTTLLWHKISVSRFKQKVQWYTLIWNKLLWCKEINVIRTKDVYSDTIQILVRTDIPYPFHSQMYSAFIAFYEEVYDLCFDILGLLISWILYIYTILRFQIFQVGSFNKEMWSCNILNLFDIIVT